MDSDQLHSKTEALAAMLQPCGRALVAFSGGVDSSLLLKFSVDVLGADNVLAVIGDSETLARSELEAALAFAARYGIRSRVVKTGEMADENFLANPGNRCFHCKNELFARLREVARAEGFTVIFDGTNADDLQGHRPGKKAAEANGVKSPLAEAGLSKAEIRRLSQTMGLPTWNKPAMACLASRFPYGQRITATGLRRVEQAERILRQQGFLNVRVRDHDGLARVEVDREQLPALLAADVARALKGLGFRYITVDLEGFRSGSMNEGQP